MSKVEAPFTPDTPPDFVELHKNVRRHIAIVGGRLFLSLAGPPWLTSKHDMPLHTGKDNARRTDEVVLEEGEVRLPGYRGVIVRGAATEVRRDTGAGGREVDVTEVLFKLYAHDPTLIRDGWAPSLDEILARTDTIGISSRGDAYINGSDEHTRIHTKETALPRRWEDTARTDQIALRVAATSLLAVDMGWPFIAGAHYRQDSVRELEGLHSRLGEMLNEQLSSTQANVWYTPLPSADRIAERVETW